MEDKKKEIIGIHNHFTIFLENTWAGIFIFASIIINNFGVTEMKNALTASKWSLKECLILVGLIAAFFLYFGFNLLRWYRTTITVKDATVTIERNSLNKLSNIIAVKNISNVNLEQNLFEMLCNTYKLKIDTNSSSTASECDIKIVLKKDMAYAVKNLIMQMMREEVEEDIRNREQNGDKEGIEATVAEEHFDMMLDEEGSNYDILYSNKEIIVNALINTNIVAVVLVLCTLIASLGSMSEDGGGANIFVRSLSVLAVFVVSLQQLFSVWLNTYHFRCRRYRDKIYISTGLLKKKRYAIPVNKINALQIKYSLIGRIVKRPYIKVVNIGGEEDETNGTMLLLSAPYEQLKEQLQLLLPELQLPELPRLNKQPKRVMVKKIIYEIVAAAVFVILFYIIRSYFPKNIPGLAVLIIYAILAIYILCTVMRNITAGLAVTPNYLVSSEGCFAKNVVMIPYNKIQNIRFSQGPVESALGVKSLTVFILADILNSVNEISAFPVSYYEPLKEHLRKTY